MHNGMNKLQKKSLPLQCPSKDAVSWLYHAQDISIHRGCNKIQEKCKLEAFKEGQHR